MPNHRTPSIEWPVLFQFQWLRSMEQPDEAQQLVDACFADGSLAIDGRAVVVGDDCPEWERRQLWELAQLLTVVDGARTYAQRFLVRQ